MLQRQLNFSWFSPYAFHLQAKTEVISAGGHQVALSLSHKISFQLTHHSRPRHRGGLAMLPLAGDGVPLGPGPSAQFRDRKG